jgi:hypothetical protein
MTDRVFTRFGRTPLVGVALLVLVAYGLAPETIRAQENQSSSSEHTKPEGTRQSPDDASDDTSRADAASARKLLEGADAITDRVGDIRGLETLSSLDKGIKNRKELRKILIEKLAEDQSETEMRHEASVFKKLGLLPRNLDYRETLLDVLTEQIAGFYDQKTEQLNIMVGMSLSLQRPAMAHEIFHAIQDQHFDLQSLFEPFGSQENGDFYLARSALVEGDATVLMIDFSLYEQNTLPQGQARSIVDIPPMANLLEQLKFDDLGALEKLASQTGADVGGEEGPDPSRVLDSALAQAPSIIQRVLVFPYFAGMRFVIAMRKGRSWEAFNEIYRHPPVSTEQILHPERYARGDEPVHLDYRPAPVLGDEYDEIYETVLGEFQMRLFLEQHLRTSDETEDSSAVDVQEAAKGWDGDRLFAYDPADDRTPLLLTHLSAWDSTRDAIEYYNALVEVMKRRFPDARIRTSDGEHGASTCLHVSRSEGDSLESERIYLERWGDSVLHVEGAPTELDSEGRETDATTYRLRDYIWETLERTPFREVLERKRARLEDERSEANEAESESNDN